ncbi:flagellin [Lachnospiraceae bacterium C10]|nr:flagellin [Lachnospiraceae bacterium C10]
MKINNNISAIISNKHLLRNEGALSASMERLSSGFRINHAADDPSGMSISNKMNAQIRGLERASRNSSDGMSVIDTADGAMTEITSMIQRMRELSVQAANDLNSYSDKEAIQLEIDNLKEEVNRISSTTEFNTKSLLDGSLDNRVYTDNVTRVQTSERVEAGKYFFTVEKAAEQASFDTGKTLPDTLANSGTVIFDGYTVELTAGMSREEVYEALRKGAEIGNTEIVGKADESLEFKSVAYGADAYLDIRVSNSELANELGIEMNGHNNAAKDDLPKGKNAEVVLDKTPDGPSQFQDHQQATVHYKGNKIVISDANGFEMSMMLDAGYDATNAPDGSAGKIQLDVTDIGPMNLQIGANEGQLMAVKVAAMDTKSLYIDDLDVTKQGGASRAIAQLDDALAAVNKSRASLGAYSNRLEHTVASLDATNENMNAAVSRIKDVDMATEMVEYTKDNVLQQAGTSALAQANELPQMALQLLQ